MRYKKMMMIAIFLVSLLAIGAVSAANNSSGNIVDDYSSDVEDSNLTSSNEPINDNLKINENNNVLDMSSETFKDLNTKINANPSDNEIYLTENYYYDSTNDIGFAQGITIDRNVTIYGNGITIDGAGAARVFKVTNYANVVFRGITFINSCAYGSNSDDNFGGAIYNEGNITAINCIFTNNTATKEMGGAIYNYEGTLKIVNSRFEKNSKYDRAIYNYGTEDDPFSLTIINTTMVEDKVCVNYDGNERRLDDKRDIDLLTTEGSVYIPEIIYEGALVLINVSGIDTTFIGAVTVNITNTIYNTNVEIAKGEGSNTLNLDINRYTARFKNFISLTDDAFERDDTKPYLEINFKVISPNSFSALDYMISKATNNVTLNQDYVFDSKTDSAYIWVVGRTLAIYGNGHSINGNGANGDTLFLIEDDSNVRMENITLENGRAQSRSHLGSQIRMGGAIYISRSNLTLINSTIKNNKAVGGSGGAIYSDFSTLNIIGSNFTNNDAENGKSIYIQGGNGVYILNTIIDEKDIDNEPDWDNNDKLAQITILNDLNAVLYIHSHVQGEDTLLDIMEPKNFTGIANLTIINNQINNIQFTNGHVFAALNLNPGLYSGTITTPDIEYYRDDGRNLTCTYLSANTTSNEFIVKRIVDVQLAVQNISYGGTETITANIDAEGNVTIILNGRIIKDCLGIVNKEIEYEIPEYLAAGNYTVEVIYNGNSYTAGNSKNAKFTVSKANSLLTASSLTTVYNGGKSIVASLKDSCGNPIVGVNVKVRFSNGKTENKISDKNGQVKFSANGLAPKTYSATISFEGNANYTKSSKTVSVKVTKATPKLTAGAKTFNKSLKTKSYTVTLKTNQNKVLSKAKVTLKVNGKTFSATTNTKGQATFKITNLNKKGSFTATVKYAGDKYYNSKTVNTKITVK